MEPTKILTAKYLDILFEGKNKEYGAYELRNTYEKRVWLSLAITTALFFITAGLAYISSTWGGKEALRGVKITEVNISKLNEDKKPIPPRLEPPKAIEQPKVKMVALVNPKVVKDVEVSNPPPSQTEIKEARISDLTQDGVKYDGLVLAPKAIDGGSGIIDNKKTDPLDDNTIFVRVEIDATYPGGSSAWKNFLERNLKGDVAVDNGAGPGVYTVIIQFVVDRQGNISNLEPITNIGYGMEGEAIRVLKKSGKWKPAIQNGKEVIAYRRQPVTFQVLEQ